MVKSLRLERIVNNRIHRTFLKKDVHLHIEILEAVVERCKRWKPNINIEDLCEQVKEKQ